MEECTGEIIGADEKFIKKFCRKTKHTKENINIWMGPRTFKLHDYYVNTNILQSNNYKSW